MPEDEMFRCCRTPFNTSTIRDWAAAHLVNPLRANSMGPIILLGSGPFELAEFREFLEQSNFDVPFAFPDPGCASAEINFPSSAIFVLGREDVKKETLASLVATVAAPEASPSFPTIRASTTEDGSLFFRSVGYFHPTFYSQGLFLLRLFAPTVFRNQFSSLLKEHSESHPALATLRDLSGFKWVSTDVSLSQNSVSDMNWPDEGMLKRMGYSVGASGKSELERRRILEAIYHSSDLPELVSREYVTKWGKHDSATRLRQIAVTIAALCRNLKRRKVSNRQAVDDWEADLGWLKQRYYDGVYDHDFKWPSAPLEI